MSRLLDKIYGCLLGGFIGDSMGAPVECMHYADIEEKYGEVNDFQLEGTDDTLLKMLLCQAILNNNGYVTADEFAEAFLTCREKQLFFIPVRNMFHRIECGLTLPVYAGLGNMQSSSSAMCISPMGIINACNPRQAAMETYDVAGLIHAGDSTFCRDGACAMAAAVAEALKPDSTVASVLKSATAYLHKTSSVEMIRCITEVLDLAEKAEGYRDFREKFYEKNLRKVLCDSRETVPCSFALFYLSGGDPEKGIIQGVNFGRDSDTIGTMVGALCGAFRGIEAFPRTWVTKLEASGSRQKELAEKLLSVAAERIQTQIQGIGLFEKILYK